MVEKPYQIATDLDRNLVTMSFDPLFWTETVLQNFIQDCAFALNSLACEPEHCFILVDLRQAVLQSRSVYDRMLDLVQAAPVRRIALVAATPLARMQTKRLQVRHNVVLFDELMAAERWLFDADRSSSAAA